jgi:hypothetical protein
MKADFGRLISEGVEVLDPLLGEPVPPQRGVGVGKKVGLFMKADIGRLVSEDLTN